MKKEAEVQEVHRHVGEEMSPEVIISWRDKIDEERPVIDSKIAATVAYATALDIAIKKQTKLLSDMKVIITAFAAGQHLPAKTINLEVEGATCKVTFKDDRVVITDPKALQDILGKKRFNDLVVVEPSYKPTDKLKELAIDADNKLADKLRAALAVKGTAPAFSFSEK